MITYLLKHVKINMWILLNGFKLKDALEYGLAHGALAMTTPGDTSMATLTEVKKLAEGGSARVQR